MPINRSVNILRSVGARGANSKTDVAAIQQQLNDLMNPPRTYLKVDGVSGNKTETAIRDFQRSVLGFRRGDGRVDPGGKTLAGLNNPMSEGKWAGMSMMPADAQPTPQTGPDSSDLTRVPDVPPGVYTASELGKIETLYAHFAKAHQRKEGKDTLDNMVINEFQIIKNLLAVPGILQYGGEFIDGVVAMKRAGFSGREIATLFKTVMTNSKGATFDELVQIFRLFSKNPRLASTLKALGRVAIVAGVIVCVIEAGNHFRKGDIGPGMAEIYAALMGAMIPWAAAMNAVQGLVYAYYPNVKDPYVDATFKLMIALDPIGAGKNAVDTGWTLIKTVIIAASTGKYPLHEIENLANRMRNSPLKPFTDLGDDLGDFMAQSWGISCFGSTISCAATDL
ncbi:peptidoglycan-binding protein [Sulfitobacter albidus]|uniref:Peptidoglycan-binding protein n=1 Tax=Sulfitobacter albidus TaxID=2829501 RepID=A0A975JHM4_9RHOB|nr:peptidoglycan-binding domain-containing protein [Sulfitobacter albidus]QUJ78105.1 peptidoglycan-binding protein [Sulfitobacter albidus]